LKPFADSGFNQLLKDHEMTVLDLSAVLDGELLCCSEKADDEVCDFAASDLLSDILTFEKERYALVTGLTNAQIIRTAEITNACCVVLVRDKQPQQAAVQLAESHGIPLVLSPLSMFEACSRIAAAVSKE
jgi:predicted transcriptional regulator